MAVTPAYVRTKLGRWVQCHSTYGVHHGILREVRPDGIVLEMPRRRREGLVVGSADLSVVHADNPTEENYENVLFFSPFFFPFFFIPFFFLFDII